MKLRSHSHCVYNLQYHLVLVTKYRKKCLEENVLQRAKEITEKLCSEYDIELVEFGGEEDHVHLLLSMHPNIMPSKFINSLKTVTSRLLRKEFSDHFRKYYWKPVLWTRAYCLLTTGGATIETIRKYIEIQGSDSSPPKS
jgi:putative transposase